MHYRLPLTFVCLITLFWLSTQAVVGTKLLELQIHIEKDVLQNFELSSQLLELKFKNLMSQDNSMESEIEQHVLATTVLNELDTGTIEVSWLHHGGIQIINAVRLLSLKPLISFWKERELFLLLKYAFYLERNRRIRPALKEYERFIQNTSDKETNSIAFAALHQGYCYALLNDIDSVLKKTSYVIDNFPASHYSRTASTLRRLILERKKQTHEIESKYKEPVQKARAYFVSGDFYTAKKAYESMGPLSVPIDMYRYARIKEEIGEVENAVKGYKEVIEKKKNSQAAMLSNRRLLLLGNLYGAGKEVKEYAEKKAKVLKDDQMMSDIKLVMTRLPEVAVVKESLKIKEIREKIRQEEVKEKRKKQLKKQQNETQSADQPTIDIKQGTTDIEIDPIHEADPVYIEKNSDDQIDSVANNDDFFLMPTDQEKVEEGEIVPIAVTSILKPRKVDTNLIAKVTSNIDLTSTMGLKTEKRMEEIEPHITSAVEPDQAKSQGFLGTIGSTIGSTLGIDVTGFGQPDSDEQKDDEVSASAETSDAAKIAGDDPQVNSINEPIQIDNTSKGLSEIDKLKRAQAAKDKRDFLASLNKIDPSARKKLITRVKPEPYLIITTKNDGTIWGKKLIYIHSYIRVDFAGTSFLITPNRLKKIEAATVIGTNLTTRKNIVLSISYEDGPKIVTPSIETQTDKEGFEHNGKLIFYEDIEEITPVDF